MIFTVKRTVNGEEKILELKPIYSNEEGVIGIERDGDRILIHTTSPKTIILGSLQYTWILF